MKKAPPTFAKHLGQDVDGAPVPGDGFEAHCGHGREKGMVEAGCLVPGSQAAGGARRPASRRAKKDADQLAGSSSTKVVGGTTMEPDSTRRHKFRMPALQVSDF